MKKEVLSLEASLKELKKFLGIWKDDETFDDDKMQKDYPDILKALQVGLLIFEGDKMVPKYILAEAVTSESGAVVLSEVSFKTRVKPSTQADLADGLKLETQTLKYALRLMAFIIGQPVAMIDNLNRKDYSVIQQVSSVFS